MPDYFPQERNPATDRIIARVSSQPTPPENADNPSLGLGIAGIGSVLGGVETLFSGMDQAEAQKEAGRYAQWAYDANARMAGYRADDAILRGEKEAASIRRAGRKLKGSQRASLAAQGIDVNQGDAAEVQDDTDFLLEADVLTVKSNAWREALGMRIEAHNASTRGMFAVQAAQAQSRSTILGSQFGAAAQGFKALGQFYRAARRTGWDRTDPAADATG